MMVRSIAPFSFSGVKKGMRARVVSIGAETTKRLQEMGLTEGAEFSVIKVAPFGDPVEIMLRGYRLCLRRRETAHIQVQLID